MWFLLIWTVVFLQPGRILSLNETCWPRANNLTCVLNDLLLGYNKQLRPNHSGRISLSKRTKMIVIFPGDPIQVQVYIMIITLGKLKTKSTISEYDLF
jgi:hypothetical protein